MNYQILREEIKVLDHLDFKSLEKIAIIFGLSGAFITLSIGVSTAWVFLRAIVQGILEKREKKQDKN